MKTIISILICLLFIFGCSENLNNPASPNPNQTGNLEFKIDKQNKPGNAAEVKSYLTRNGFDTLTASLNLISDTTAAILMTNIPAGEWHLRVDALDNNQQVVYSGQTDVTVLAEITVDIYLTLYPTGNGFGNISITVTWGTNPNKDWIDYQNNPILTQFSAPLPSPYGVSQAKVIVDNGIFKMWYDKLYNAGRADIWYAESYDGINWTNFETSPALPVGDSLDWDSHSVQIGAVLLDNNQYSMYYTGENDVYGNWNIGMATSSDGRNWTKSAQPVLLANNLEYQLHVDAVIKSNNQYYMYYTIRDPRYYPIHYAIGLARSTNGKNWVRSDNNPILTQSQSWEGYGIYFPSVIIDNNKFTMLYMNSLSNGFGLATSTDGVYWTKSTANPIFTNYDTHNNWAIGGISYPYFIKTSNDYRIYYTGQGYNNVTQSIGMVVQKN
jgi:predicted GH43/DUF377 family glycosyl hydrolase